jgi:uncharacterized protein YndB with AHSA1/START domain
MIPVGPVTARRHASVSRESLWTCLADPEHRADWWPDLELEPRVGGIIAERWAEGDGDDFVERDASGEVDVWVVGHAIGFWWLGAGDHASTSVLISLLSDSGETIVTVTETGFDAFADGAHRVRASAEGWAVLLDDLIAAIEAGE